MSDFNWHSFHFYYYDDRDRVLLDAVLPIVRKLLNLQEVDNFFFIRYGLGGPHVRLRLQVLRGAEERVAVEVERAAHRFFGERPSRRRIEPELLARTTARISLQDPTGRELEIQPDNSLLRASFEPETERYGGSRYLPASLGLFALSSATVLRCLGQIDGSAGRGRLLAVAAEILWRQALGYARDSTELERLLAYSLEQWGQEHPRAAEQATESWGRQQEDLVALALREIERRRSVLARPLPLDAAQDPLATGSFLLSRALGHLEPVRRIYIGWSHLHMTANRLGLRNSEEVLLSSLLSAALKETRQRHPETVGRLDAEAEPAECGGSPAHDLSAGLGLVLQRILAGVDVSP